ncbi:MAG: hypothetical protein LBK83_12370 [Treponema sp.]|jgi:hypothetical protein|nr:hypothetical protein [Treponema sp.]
MCGVNKRYFSSLLFALFFVSAAGVLQAGEGEPAAYIPVYLISEAELRSIEEYQAGSAREKQSWLLRVSELRIRAEKLEADSRLLNGQLSTVREQSLILEQSFNEYEAESLMTISMKNGEIADLRLEVADKMLEAATYRGTARSRLIIIIGLAGSWIIFIAFKICRFFRII